MNNKRPVNLKWVYRPHFMHGCAAFFAVVNSPASGFPNPMRRNGINTFHGSNSWVADLWR